MRHTNSEAEDDGQKETVNVNAWCLFLLTREDGGDKDANDRHSGVRLGLVAAFS